MGESIREGGHRVELVRVTGLVRKVSLRLSNNLGVSQALGDKSPRRPNSTLLGSRQSCPLTDKLAHSVRTEENQKIAAVKVTAE